MCLRVFTQSTTCVHPHLKRSCEKPRTDFQLSYVVLSLFATIPSRRKNSRSMEMLLLIFIFQLFSYIFYVSHASAFPPSLCCDAFNVFIQYMEFCISSVLEQVFNFSGLSGCANDHLHVKNECTHNSAATHKYRKVQNWRLQYAI